MNEIMDRQNDQSDNETTHTSAKKPILDISITDKPINMYNHHIIFI